jgi:hypothetical protein
MKKNKLVTGLIVLATLVLAGVAIFTAIRIYQLRNQAVSPANPSSEPEAAMPGIDDAATEGQTGIVTFKCGTITQTTKPVREKKTVKDGDNCDDRGSGPCRTIRRVTVGSTTTTSKFDVIITPVSESPSCPRTTTNYLRCDLQQKNEVIDYSATYEIKAERATAPVTVKVLKNSNWCKEPCGHYPSGICTNSGKREEATLILNAANGYKTTVTIARKADSGKACGTFQTDIWFTYISDCMQFTPPAGEWGTLTWSMCYTGKDCPLSTATPMVGSCSNFAFSLTTPTATATATSTSTATATATSTATSTSTATATSTSTSTAVATGTPTPTLASCNNTCDTSDDCRSGLTCSEGVCRNPSCVDRSNCTCTIARTSEPEMPNAGVSLPTIAGIGSALLLLVVSLALAL